MKTLILIIIFITTSALYSNEENPSKFISNIIEESKPALIKKDQIFLEKTMEKYTDFDEMSIWIAGKNIWLKSTQEERNNFIYELKKLMLKTYSKTVYYYIDANISFITLKGQNNNNKILQKRIQISTIMKKNNKNVNISYRLIKNNNSWLVFDIMIEGISILKSFKTQYNDMIRTKGLIYATNKIKSYNE